MPDYYDIIKHPMCWDTIDQKLDRHEYLDLAQFKVPCQIPSQTNFVLARLNLH